MDQYSAYRQRIGDSTGMLTSRSTKTDQLVIAQVVATDDRNLFDGVRHVLDRDPDEALGHLFARPAHCLGHRIQSRLRGQPIQWLISGWAKDHRKESRLNSSQGQVAI